MNGETTVSGMRDPSSGRKNHSLKVGALAVALTDVSDPGEAGRAGECRIWPLTGRPTAPSGSIVAVHTWAEVVTVSRIETADAVRIVRRSLRPAAASSR